MLTWTCKSLPCETVAESGVNDWPVAQVVMSRSLDELMNARWETT